MQNTFEFDTSNIQRIRVLDTDLFVVDNSEIYASFSVTDFENSP